MKRRIETNAMRRRMFFFLLFDIKRNIEFPLFDSPCDDNCCVGCVLLRACVVLLPYHFILPKAKKSLCSFYFL